MYLYKIFVLCFLYSVCSAKEEDVLEFSDSDFESGIAEHETALVMFYAPW
jgi:protein disulfide isomerase family A protein 3